MNSKINKEDEEYFSNKFKHFSLTSDGSETNAKIMETMQVFEKEI